MAMAAKKTHCSICGKDNGRVTCEGCSKLFCLSHFNGHRQELATQLDEIEVTRDLFRETLTENLAKAQNHALIQQINEWENESINKIRQTAEEARQILLKHIAELNNKLESELNKLTNQLRESRQENDFFEPNLNQWREKLTQMKNKLVQSSNVTIQNDSTPLVTKITVVTSHNNSIMKHNETTYAVNQNFNVLCSFCEEQFTSEKSLMEHLMMCGNKTDQCPNCRKSVRRAIISYHYENNCTNPDPDAPSTDDGNQKPSHQELLLVTLRCPFCGQNSGKADYKMHKQKCLHNPENRSKNQRPLIDENFNQNPDRSRQLNEFDDNDRIPCEWCNKRIQFYIYEQHAKTCRDEEHRRLEENSRRTDQYTVPPIPFNSPVTTRTPSATDTAPCKFCGRHMTLSGISYHQLICVQNPNRNKI